MRRLEAHVALAVALVAYLWKIGALLPSPPKPERRLPSAGWQTCSACTVGLDQKTRQSSASSIEDGADIGTGIEADQLVDITDPQPTEEIGKRAVLASKLIHESTSGDTERRM